MVDRIHNFWIRPNPNPKNDRIRTQIRILVVVFNTGIIPIPKSRDCKIEDFTLKMEDFHELCDEILNFLSKISIKYANHLKQS